jgi:hypothetical protein
MRLPHVRLKIQLLMLVGAIVVLGGPDLLACSGPGAAKIIRESELIGWSLAGLSIAIVAGGCSLLRRRSLGHRIPWIVAPLVLHPRWWMDAVHGDCGYGLRFWSFVATLGIAVAVALAICWPRRAETESKKWRWTLGGALAGALAGLLIAALILERPGSMSEMTLPLVGATLCSLRVVTGAAGSVEYFLYASVRGREGLLGRTETVSYNPWLIRVEAAGYRPFFTSLASDPPIPPDRLTARPLGLAFPPPPSVTIRLTPSASADGAESQSGRHPLAP